MPTREVPLRKDSHLFSEMCAALLRRGNHVRFRAQGASMQPNLLDGDQVLLAPAAISDLCPGDVALVETSNGLRLHRVKHVASRRRHHSGRCRTRTRSAIRANRRPRRRIFQKRPRISVKRLAKSLRSPCGNFYSPPPPRRHKSHPFRFRDLVRHGRAPDRPRHARGARANRRPPINPDRFLFRCRHQRLHAIPRHRLHRHLDRRRRLLYLSHSAALRRLRQRSSHHNRFRPRCL